MKNLTTILFLIIFPLLSMGFPENEASNSDSEKSASSGKKTMAIKGKLLFEDDFKTPIEYTKEFKEVKPGWKVKTAHAQWKQSGGKVESIYESGHMPVLVYSGLFTDAVIELDFRFFSEEGKWAACRISATNPELNPRAYSASVWANLDNKARARGMVLEHDEWKPGVITTVDTLMAMFKPGKWYTLRLELVGDYARATCNGVTVYGTHEKFGIPKNSIYLGVGTCRHELRNFRIYEATMNPKWEHPKSK
jgi:hypothetical protein